MWIDNNENTISKATNITIDGIDYSKSIFANDEFLGQLGISKLTEDSVPDRRYYSYSETINVETKNVDRIPVEKDINIIKDRMINSLSKSFKELSGRPQADTGLGYSIDCGIDDIKRLEIGRELGVNVIVDVDGAPHSATADDYGTVIFAMKTKGLQLYQQKWTKKAMIESFTTVQECIDYENEEVEYQSPVMDENLEPVLDEHGNQVYQTSTKTVNNIMVWN